MSLFQPQLLNFFSTERRLCLQKLKSETEKYFIFPKERDFLKIILNCVEDQNAWIFPPSEIQFYISNDGKKFELLSTQQPILKPNTEGAHIRQLGVDKKGKARYIKVVAKPQNPIPDWHKGAGGKGWIFADEIIVD